MSLHKQRGAVMVVGLLLLGAAVIAWQHRTSLSQTILVQQSLDQATVAAAVGVAHFHARILNAHAMLNRTQMAHQVAMAHLMTLASAWEMRRNLGNAARRRNPPASLIGYFFGPNHGFAYGSARAGGDPHAIASLRMAFARHDVMLSTRLRKVRNTLKRNLAQQSKKLATEIVRRNLGAGLWAHPSVTVQVHNAGGLATHVRMMRDHDRWQRWMDNVMKRHGYLKSRWQIRISLWPIYPDCPVFKHILTRTGETVISVDGDWYAQDSVAFHKVLRFAPEVCFYREYPMGWSNLQVTAQAGADSVESGFAVRRNLKGTTYRKWALTLGKLALGLFNPFDNAWSKMHAQGEKIRWSRRSYPMPYDINPVGLNPVVKVSTRLAASTLKRTNLRVRVDLPGLLEANRQMWPSYLSARAAATVEFDPLNRSTSAEASVPNLLQPFWTVRQVPVQDGWVR